MKKEDLFRMVLTKPDMNLKKEMKDSWDGIAKPIDSLGLLEDLVIKVGTIKGKNDIVVLVLIGQKHFLIMELKKRISPKAVGT